MAYYFITFPVIIIALVLLIIIIYRIIYKQNMNRALEGRATTGLIEIGPLLKTLTVIALVIMNIVSLTRIEDLNWQLRSVESNLTNQINSLRNQISGMSNEMEQYYQSLELVQDPNVELESVDLANNDYTFTVQFSLNELEDTSADIYLVIEHEGSTEKILLDSDTLTFTKDVVLKYSMKAYDFSVLIEGSKMIQEEIDTIYVNRYEDNIIGLHSDIGDSEKGIIIYGYVFEDVKLVEGVDVASVMVKVIQNKEVVKTYSMTTSTTLNNLLSSYSEYEYWEQKEEVMNASIYGFVYEVEEFQDIQFEYTITLTDGTVIERSTDEFFELSY